MLAINGELQ